MGIRPLNKIRILDLTQDVCGPFCTQLLSDLGAEVIKVESPDGDISRSKGPRAGEGSLAYIHTNRGKKSVMLDITNPKHRNLFLGLAEKADVVVEDLGPGKAEELGIGYADVKNRKHDILYLSITDFGHEGPFRDFKGNDAIIQAMGGYMSTSSAEYKGRFTKVGPPLADLMTGVYGAIGVVAGVIHRKKTGESLYMDVAKLSVILQAMPNAYAEYFNSGEVAFPTGNSHRTTASFYPMPAKNGSIVVNAANRNVTEHKFEDFCIGIGMPDFFKDERYSTEASRLEHKPEVMEAINAHTMEMTVEEIFDLCRKSGIACGIMSNMEQLVSDPQTVHDQVIIDVHDAKAGDFKVLGSPFKFDAFETPKSDMTAYLGQHTESVLTELLGMGTEEVAEIWKQSLGE